MREGWRRPIADGTFFATNLDGEGAVLKVNATFDTIHHNDRHLGHDELGKRSIPEWAMQWWVLLISRRLSREVFRMTRFR